MSSNNKPVAKIIAVDKQSKTKTPILAVWDNDGRLSFSMEKGVRIISPDGVELTFGRDGGHYGNVYVNAPLAVTGGADGGGGGRQSAPVQADFVDGVSEDDIPW